MKPDHCSHQTELWLKPPWLNMQTVRSFGDQALIAEVDGEVFLSSDSEQARHSGGVWSRRLSEFMPDDWHSLPGLADGLTRRITQVACVARNTWSRG